MPSAGRALQVRPAPAMRFAVLSLILLVLAAPAEARLIAPDIDAVGAAPPSNAQVPLALMLQDETGAPRTLQAAIAHTPAVLILADYACQALCGPVLALAGASLERSGLTAGTDYRLIVIGLDPRKGSAHAKANARSRPSSRREQWPRSPTHRRRSSAGSGDKLIGRFEIGCQACNSSSSALACLRSSVSNPSVNQP
jgi:hypothetical protein